MFLSKVVKLKTGHKHVGQAGDWNVALTFNWKEIPKDLELTQRARNHWIKTAKSPFWCASFKTLRTPDIISVLSAAKNRRGVVLDIERQGRIAAYKLVDKEGKVQRKGRLLNV